MTKPVSALRQRMIDDMKIRNMALSTHDICLRAVARYSACHGCSPDKQRYSVAVQCNIRFPTHPALQALSIAVSGNPTDASIPCRSR